MARKNKNEDLVRFSDDEVAAMTDLQKLGRIRYLEDEIATTKDHLKAQKESAKDYIGECEAKRQQLLETVPMDVGAAESSDPQ